MKKRLLPLLVIVGLAACKKNNYNCTCVTTAVGYTTETDTLTVKNTKNAAKKECTGRNYTSQIGDVTMNCTLN
jgi:hypothetical protein